MTAYLIGEVFITDESWVSSYAINVHEIAHKHGGKYLSRSGNIKQVEGKRVDISLIALVEFPNLEAAQAFIDDPDYQEFRKLRMNGSNSTVHIIDNSDAAGTIPYLK
ncbi:MAG: hypothetical protein CMK44_05515 [Porticoccus sp.]|jgi:uncharacterized protein (DUF1330 family)|nr:hypothetical protein [Porticoccus sp.]|tara:strand:- start:1131 stop:1451 length:321 start_codon:yes stop_codon:yes gene_type:complete